MATSTLFASAARTSSAGSSVVDCGLGVAQGRVVLDISALHVSDGDNLYVFTPQLSSVAAFNDASLMIDMPARVIANPAIAITPSTITPIAQTYVIPFTNVIFGTAVRYMRLYFLASGTGKSVTFGATLELVRALGAGVDGTATPGPDGKIGCWNVSGGAAVRLWPVDFWASFNAGIVTLTHP